MKKKMHLLSINSLKKKKKKKDILICVEKKKKKKKLNNLVSSKDIVKGNTFNTSIVEMWQPMNLKHSILLFRCSHNPFHSNYHALHNKP